MSAWVASGGSIYSTGLPPPSRSRMNTASVMRIIVMTPANTRLMM